MIEILAKGMLTTVQDGGRRGYQKLGVPVCGAMDGYGLAQANLLVGNPLEEAALEVTGMGPTVKFLSGCVFAVAGADFSPALSDAPIETGRAYSAAPGSVLTLGSPREGFRCYIAFAGGLAVQPVMGSRSTYLGGGFGGWQGRALDKGDKIPLAAPVSWLPNMSRRRLECSVENRPLRLVPGPQAEHFSEYGLETLFSAAYTVSPQSDRMGYRTKGPKITFALDKGPNIISDGIVRGSVQVPDGTPIIMMADAQTVGGYAKAGTVISVDLPVLAQRRPGERITFAPVTVEEGQALYRAQGRYLRGLSEEINRWSVWD